MKPPDFVTGLSGGLLRMIDAAGSAAPTLIVGLGIAAILRYYLGPTGTRKLFGGESLRAIPQSWAVGMLLPVCSIGVLPIMVEMHRSKVKPGALSAFALSAPLFNPLSLLYGLTLSRPYVVLSFAFGSLIVVTLVGLIWDARVNRSTKNTVESDSNSEGAFETPSSENDQPRIIGIRRLAAVALHMTRSLAGSTGGWALVALLGLLALSMLLPNGAMQGSVGRDDWNAPAIMTGVAIPIYATPMLAMTQLGMMFQHANSPGAAFVLLVLGTGVNLATLAWLARTFGLRSVGVWFGSLSGIVLTIAYAVNAPLVPSGVEPALHTHAFDIYTNPFQSGVELSANYLAQQISSNLDLWERAGLVVVLVLCVLGLLARALGWTDERLCVASDAAGASSDVEKPTKGFDRNVPPQVIGATMLVGLIAISVVMCYGYYPGPRESLKEIAVLRAECLTAANSGNAEHALYHLQMWDDWSRRLEVGTFLRYGEVRPYQRMQGYLLRKKLEMLEHELEHDPFEIEEVREVVRQILESDHRWKGAFNTDKGLNL